MGLIKQPGTVAPETPEQALTVVNEGGRGTEWQDHSLPSQPCPRKQPPAPGGVGTAYGAQEGLSQSPTVGAVHTCMSAQNYEVSIILKSNTLALSGVMVETR